MPDIHSDLAGAIQRSRVVSIVFVVAAVIPFVVAFLLPERLTVIPRIALIADAVLTAGLGWLIAWSAPAWYRRAGEILTTAAPRRMRLTLSAESSGDSGTTLYALLSPAGGEAKAPLKFSLIQPSWDYRGFVDGTEVEVVADPKPGGPVVIRTPQGLLWASASPGNRFKRLP